MAKNAKARRKPNGVTKRKKNEADDILSCYHKIFLLITYERNKEMVFGAGKKRIKDPKIQRKSIKMAS